MGKNQEEMWTNFEPRHEHTRQLTLTLAMCIWLVERVLFGPIKEGLNRPPWRERVGKIFGQPVCIYFCWLIFFLSFALFSPSYHTGRMCTCHHSLYHFKSPYNTSVCVCRSNLGQGSDNDDGVCMWFFGSMRCDVVAKAQVVGQVGKSMQVLLWWWWWLLLLTVAMVLMILACLRHYTSYCEWMAMKQATNVKVV